ncbi:MAG: cytochrome c biogenesis protein CcdA, partial [Chloroflexota bacterium]|nr:cytochrome c biogenesis protein CcdA [Chloroflexota bacterium]
EQGGSSSNHYLTKHGVRALAMSGMVTLGFVAFFGIIGAILSLGGGFLLDYIPWIAIVIASVLIVMGIYTLSGGHLYTNLPSRLASLIGGRGEYNLKGFLLYGIAYAIAALSCTLSIFLVVVGSAIALKGFVSGMIQFVSFGLGMGFVIAVITIGTVMFKETVNRWLHRLVPVVARASGLLLIFAGGYILYYWFTVGDILD